jgi:outer membrane receptor for Fe3+-dicitrate
LPRARSLAAITRSLKAKNLFDEQYIVDRTRGILPAAPRLIQVGLKQNF